MGEKPGIDLIQSPLFFPPRGLWVPKFAKSPWNMHPFLTLFCIQNNDLTWNFSSLGLPSCCLEFLLWSPASHTFLWVVEKEPIVMGSVGGGHWGLQLWTAVLDYGRVCRSPKACPAWQCFRTAECGLENLIRSVDQQWIDAGGSSWRRSTIGPKPIFYLPLWCLFFPFRKMHTSACEWTMPCEPFGKTAISYPLANLHTGLPVSILHPLHPDVHTVITAVFENPELYIFLRCSKPYNSLTWLHASFL